MKNNGVFIYAELLSNIRQVSIATSLPSPTNARTVAKILDGGRRLCIEHDGQTMALDLPGTVSSDITLQLPQSPSTEMTWRLPLSCKGTPLPHFTPETQDVPWAALDLEPGSPVCCRNCNSIIISKHTIQSWKDLPSENWAEMMEFWHCHKPHDHSELQQETLANRGYGANNAITAQSGIGFTDITSFMFDETDCQNLLDYIPGGCLEVSLDETTLSKESWDATDLKIWKSFRHYPPDQHFENQPHAGNGYLPTEVQDPLVQLEDLHLVCLLFKSRWIDLEFRVNANGSYGTVRVYLLPDDAYRGLIDRTSLSLKKARSRLLHLLDYSKNVWDGLAMAGIDNSSSLKAHCVAKDENESLLQLFNNIPSPNPNSGLVSDVHARDSMNDILDRHIPGVTTELYSYQRRSVAIMVQKEAEPSKVIDPRLIAMDGHDGTTWYADPVVGSVLKEPRYYDSICGGILAEEMGAGKTIICLALILATKNLSTRPPELYEGVGRPQRSNIASLADMAASCATRHAIPWRSYFETWRRQVGYEFRRCEAALKRNPGYYLRPAPIRRRTGRHPVQEPAATKTYLSNATVVVVPTNLLSQWKHEIEKHTVSLKVLVLDKHEEVPPIEEMLDLDIILFSQSRFERLVKQYGGVSHTELSAIHFKRCIVDEGHKLGNSRMGRKSNLLLGLDGMNFSSRWIVTGTPSHGLFGVNDRVLSGHAAEVSTAQDYPPKQARARETSEQMEKRDLERLGSITSLYLKARPWANVATENEDTCADWGTYLLLPRHNKKSYGRWDCLKATLNSLIIRHRLSEVGDLLPPVNEKVIILEGSFQDRLSLNLFAMMIIFNSVQSQRTDMDYFFHPRQRKSLLEIVHNLKQSSFFGGSFFSSEEITTAVETAERFLEEEKVPISNEDNLHLRKAIKPGKVAIDDKLRTLSNRYHDIPIRVHGPLGDAGHSWSLDDAGGDTICTSASMIMSLQKLLAKAASETELLNSLLNGGLIQKGLTERNKILAAQGYGKDGKEKKSATLAGNTKLGDDNPRRHPRCQSAAVNPTDSAFADNLPPTLRQTSLVSTVSSKLSYLIDSVVRHQVNDKIIIFYENENSAWYLASVLDMLHIKHLIYAKTLTTERKTQYVNTFHHNSAFRVLLMDLSQAAFGLDMHEASRVYFINPVLNPQVEAQAIGRVCRISQQKPVFVETLVLKDSIDEVILERKQHMTQAEHRQMKSILDVRPIYNWIKNVAIVAMPHSNTTDHMAPLQVPQTLFGKGFGTELHPNDGLILGDPIKTEVESASLALPGLSTSPIKRTYDNGPGDDSPRNGTGTANIVQNHELVARPARRVRFASGSDPAD
ncbi:SNF2 family helicase [Metarhizium rileyi]|uniref:SNF2 family helicase n=1 Tax=Metarhizium rileyi (strain RCEF 4871) TaxID=1649241 RepID=A0A167I7X3_METRR|nr:SNF2 family helicase [Metarhizium rileyi RCEF 4871]